MIIALNCGLGITFSRLTLCTQEIIENETTDTIGNCEDCTIHRHYRLRGAGDSGLDEESNRPREIMDLRGGVHECFEPVSDLKNINLDGHCFK